MGRESCKAEHPRFLPPVFSLRFSLVLPRHFVGKTTQSPTIKSTSSSPVLQPTSQASSPVFDRTRPAPSTTRSATVEGNIRRTAFLHSMGLTSRYTAPSFASSARSVALLI